MVDPNRKINRLSDDDAAFLVECEQEFRNRYTEGDDEFATFLAKPTKTPPIVEPWRRNDSGNNWNRNNYRPNNRNQYNRNNDNRSQRGRYRQNYNRPYDRNFRREGDNNHRHGQGHGHGQSSSHPY